MIGGQAYNKLKLELWIKFINKSKDYRLVWKKLSRGKLHQNFKKNLNILEKI